MLNKIKFNLVPFLLSALFLSITLCTPAADKNFIPDNVYYIDTIQGKFRDFPPPPSSGSETDNKDISVLREWQAKRSASDCNNALSEARGNYEALFGKISPFVKPQPVEVGEFFKRVHNDLDYSVGNIKSRYQRLRPYQRGLKLEPCIDRVHGFSYPSGHSVNSRIFGLILSDIQPEKRAVYMSCADEAALNRVIGGVHHPSDIEAGKTLADKIYIELKKNPSFVKDRDALKKYLAK